MTAYLQHLLQRRDVAVRAAQGRWREIFVSCGIDGRLVDGKGRPCPLCGGRDRFSFTNKFGRGDYFCRNCGHGDGFDLVAAYLQCSFPEALRTVERFCAIEPPEFPQGSASRGETGGNTGGETGGEEPGAQKSPEDAARENMLRIWAEAHPVREGDAVWKYLAGRGLDPARAHPEIRTHEGLPYHSARADGETFPVMLSRITNHEGIVINLHRTFLSPEGGKASVEHPKKLMPGLSTAGVVRLGGIPGNGVIGLAEGVETALGASLLAGMPVWATIGCGNMAAIDKLPEGVREVVVFADNDEKYAGQAAAYAFAHRWACRGLSVHVMVPPNPGEDWLDVWNARAKQQAGAAPGVAG